MRQGGILSPFSFKFHINSIIDNISSLEEGCNIGISKINILAYADDIALVANTKEHMNLIYDRLKSQLEGLGL